MKLIRVGNPGEEKPGVLREDDTRTDVTAFGEDYDENFFGTAGPSRLAAWLEQQAWRTQAIEPLVLNKPGGSKTSNRLP